MYCERLASTTFAQSSVCHCACGVPHTGQVGKDPDEGQRGLEKTRGDIAPRQFAFVADSHDRIALAAAHEAEKALTAKATLSDIRKPVVRHITIWGKR